MKRVTIKSGMEARARSGHLWIFNNELDPFPRDLEPGELVDVFLPNGRLIGRGYGNPHSLITVRILTQKDEDIGEDFFRRRIQEALRYREEIFPGDDAYRLIYSEGDLLPGLIVDRYGEYLSVQALTRGIYNYIDDIVRILADIFSPRAIVLRNDARLVELEGMAQEKRVLWGELNGEPWIAQDGLRFRVDLMEGQKTGFYLDHRENRRLLKGLVGGRRVLDVFCYTGAWSLYAAHFGAESVMGIDSSKRAVETAMENAEENGLAAACAFTAGDALKEMNRMRKEGMRFGCVILDPPAFAKSKKELKGAVKGYIAINRYAMDLVEPGGFLVTSSCTQHLDREGFMWILRKAAALSGRRAHLLRSLGQSRDHPILLSVPETEYLKGAVLKLI